MALNAKITLSLLALVLGLSGVFWWASQQQGKIRDQLFMQELHRPLAANLVKEGPLLEGDEIRPDALEHVFHTLMVVNPSIEVYLLDPTGAILTYSAPYRRVQMQQVNLAPIQAFLANDAQLPITGDNPREPSRQQVFSAATIYQNEQLSGYLYVVLGGDLHQAAVGKTAWVGIWHNAGIGLLTLVAFALLCGALFWLTLTRRLRRLDQAVSLFRRDLRSNGERAGPIDPTLVGGGKDEIANLADSCATMSQTILQQIEQLTYTDQMRRQLVANVSHDLRTPLASLEGYLETILVKKDQLSPTETRQHVATAYKGARRLRRLIAELFELARLEADDREPSLELFSIAELASDVVQKMQVIAAKRGVRIEIDVQEQAHFAVAEIGLIERVLENLLINAIQHSPEDSRVRVEIIRSASERVNIAVVDEGAGIAERELPHIFDRFYRPDHGGDHRTEGAGLGLAIVKRIIDLHNSSIEAISKPGHGSAFAFWLPTKVPAAG